MLAPGFEGPGAFEQLPLVVPGEDLDHGGPPEGERARLVEGDGP
jgi:hypothetical protein